MEEEKTCISSYFVTLTYRTNDLPRDIHAFKADAQNWLKRVRNLVGFRTVRYIIVSTMVTTMLVLIFIVLFGIFL